MHEALESVEEAISTIDEEIASLSKELAEKVTAMVVFPMTSLVYADAYFFAEAGRKIRTSLSEARNHYVVALNSLRLDRGFARAYAQHLELRFRELGAQGFFYNMSLAEVKSSDLDEFTLRR